MIRFSWLQSRIQLLVAGVALAITAVVLLVTGPHIAHLYDTVVANCSSRGDCQGTDASFIGTDHLLQGTMDSVALLVPVLLGLFWGAPLIARELENGTYRLAWTQSVTRRRWAVTKLAFGGLTSMAVGGLISLMVGWWSSPFDRVNANRFSNALFGERGLTPIGYAALAFAVGAAAGVLLRRTLPAMVTALVAYIAARVAIAFEIRPHLFTPRVRDLPLNFQSVDFGSQNGGPFIFQANPPFISNGWVYSANIVNGKGTALSPQTVVAQCPRLQAAAQTALGPRGGSGRVVRSAPPASFQSAVQGCLDKVGRTFHEVVTYQPASRYWAFQWSELAVCLAAAMLLAAFTVLWVRRRLV